MFTQLAVEHGALVVNDPDDLAMAQNKAYLQGFPELVRSKTKILKNLKAIRAIIGERSD